ncbi:MAG TPA: hypothetical protein VGS07_27935 [Thermoanaerobaculia bacterium]|jgi:hypothetical protein|nr:hypothetical protein [Thermoanaerobaculia bacterium]
MPKESRAELFGDWTTLLGGVDDWLADIPSLRPLRDEMAAMILDTKALANEQISLKARAQAVTQQLVIMQGRGKDLAVRVRAAVRAHYGHRNEGLVRFNIRPVRRRSRAMVPGEASVMPIPAADSHSEP